MCSLGKKDAEGWETVQRGRTAKPRSAAMLAKVCPVLAHVTPKQESAKIGQSHLKLQEEQQPKTPFTKDATLTHTEQQVPAEPDTLEEVVHPGNGDMIEVLMFSAL